MILGRKNFPSGHSTHTQSKCSSKVYFIKCIVRNISLQSEMFDGIEKFLEKDSINDAILPFCVRVKHFKKIFCSTLPKTCTGNIITFLQN